MDPMVDDRVDMDLLVSVCSDIGCMVQVEEGKSERKYRKSDDCLGASRGQRTAAACMRDQAQQD